MARQDRCLRLLDKIDDNDIDGVKDVLQYDVDLTVDRKGDTPMHAAARKGSLQILKLLVAKGGDVNLKNLNGYAPIHYAARDGRMDIVNYFLECGADPNTQNKDGDAPIHELVKVQPMDVIEEMVSLGMNVNLQNKMGRTPLHVATRNDRHEATETLLTHGADGKIRDKHGKTAEESCTNPELADRMKLHDLMMEALRKGTVKAQGVSLRKTKKTMELNRVGIVVESFENTSILPASFYCRREKSENTTMTIPTDNGDEMISDVFYLKITDVPRSCHMTLTVPIYGIPKHDEELFVRYQSGKKETVTKYDNSDEDHTCTFTTELFPECFSICALFTCAKTDVQLVGKDGATVTTELVEELKIEIPPDAFDSETKVSIQVFPNNETDKDKSDILLTDVYNIQADTGEVTCQNRQNMKLTLPTHGNIQQPEDVVLLTLNEITDDTDEDSIEVVDSVVKLVDKTLVYEIPHFSIHVAVPRACFSAGRSEIYKRLVSATERQRTAVFFVVVRGEHSETTESSLAIVECCVAEKASHRLEKWKGKGYEIQSPVMSGSFMLKPYQEFNTAFKGVQPPDASYARKIAFLPRRPSYQPYRVAQDDTSDTNSIYVEGTVYIRVVHNDQRDKEAEGECLTAIPFRIERQNIPPPKEDAETGSLNEEHNNENGEETVSEAGETIDHKLELEVEPITEETESSDKYADSSEDQTRKEESEGSINIDKADGTEAVTSALSEGSVNVGKTEGTEVVTLATSEEKGDELPKVTKENENLKKKARKPFLYPK